MNSGQRKTLERVFNDPIKSDIPWTDIEGLFRALGAEITEGSGSRVRIKLHGERAIFHRPHPEKTTDGLRQTGRFIAQPQQEIYFAGRNCSSIFGRFRGTDQRRKDCKK